MPKLLHDHHLRRNRFRWPEETYDGWVLLCVSEGAFRYWVSDNAGTETTGEARFGDLVWTPPGYVLGRRALSVQIYMHFIEWNADDPARWLPPAGMTTVRGDDRARLASTLAAFDTLTSHLPPSTEAQSWRDHLLNDLLFLCRMACAERDAQKTDSLMEQAARLLRESFADRSFSLQSLAHALALSPVQLSRRFAVAHGCTPSAYQSTWRLQQAQTMLLATDFTIDHIAHACGYRDGFYLCRVFRKALQITPSAYRHRHRL